MRCPPRSEIASVAISASISARSAIIRIIIHDRGQQTEQLNLQLRDQWRMQLHLRQRSPLPTVDPMINALPRKRRVYEILSECRQVSPFRHEALHLVEAESPQERVDVVGQIFKGLNITLVSYECKRDGTTEHDHC